MKVIAIIFACQIIALIFLSRLFTITKIDDELAMQKLNEYKKNKN